MKLGLYIWRFASAAVAVLPAPVVETVARGIGVVIYYSWVTRQNVARDNFGRVLGKKPRDPEVGRVARRALSNYCVYILDMLRYPRVPFERFEQRVEIREEERLKDVLAEDKPLIVVSAHFGNMDYAAAVAAKRYRRFTLAAETIKPVELFEYLARLRSERGTDLIPYDRAPRKIIEAIRRKEIVGFLIDFGVNSQKDIHNVEVTFFGDRTRFPSSPAILAQRFGAPLLVAFTHVTDEGRIEVDIEPPIYIPADQPREDVERQVMQLVAQRFEKYISAHPDQWYVFRPMWPRPQPRRRPLLKRLTAALNDGS